VSNEENKTETKKVNIELEVDTNVVDSSKNMTAARGPSDTLSKAERKRLEQLTGGYG